MDRDVDLNDSIARRAKQAMPTEMANSACGGCGELPPGAHESDPMTWFWDVGEAHRHDGSASA